MPSSILGGSPVLPWPARSPPGGWATRRFSCGSLAEGRNNTSDLVGKALYWVFFPFVIVGAVFLARRFPRRLLLVLVPIVVTAVTVVLVYGSTRMRALGEPSLAVLAATDIVITGRWLRKRLPRSNCAQADAPAAGTVSAGPSTALEMPAVSSQGGVAAPDPSGRWHGLDRRWLPGQDRPGGGWRLATPTASRWRRRCHGQFSRTTTPCARSRSSPPSEKGTFQHVEQGDHGEENDAQSWPPKCDHRGREVDPRPGEKAA